VNVQEADQGAVSRPTLQLRRSNRTLGMSLVFVLLLSGVVVGAPIPATPAEAATCQNYQKKYDHKTWFVTWFTNFNEFRVCYNNTTTTSIEWTDNWTTAPTLPYVRKNVTTLAVREDWRTGEKRARNRSRHSMGCGVGPLNAFEFDITLEQRVYREGQVWSSRWGPNNLTDC